MKNRSEGVVLLRLASRALSIGNRRTNLERRCLSASAAVICALVTLLAQAQDRSVTVASEGTPDANLKRNALVIGNGAYSDAPLRNPVNDADAIANALKTCGFAVTTLTDGNLKSMEEAIDAFGVKIRGGGTALFYYSGHGIQVENENYLVPVGASLAAENEARYECVNMGRVLAKMENADTQVNIVILDACRNNPFARSFRSASSGLAQMSAAKGTIIAFATAPGRVAADGAGQNGLYTACLLQNLRRPGVPLEEVFKSVREQIVAKQGDNQIPWENSSLIGKFYFVPSDVPTPPGPVASLPPPPAAAAVSGALQVSVNVARATVKVDGKDRGTAKESEPLRLTELPAREVKVEVLSDGYEPQSKTVKIPLNDWANEPFVLQAKARVVQGEAKPAAVRVTQGGGDYKTGEVRTFSGIAFVWCPPGSFVMGSPQSEENRDDDETQHRVTLSKGFWMGKTEVTQAQWRAVMGDNPSYFKGDDRPVEQVSWEDCQSFVRKLNAQTEGKFRLPCEAEWEYACRAGSATAYGFGNDADQLGAYAWYDANSSGETHAVGQKNPNAWGLLDMHGNVWEWCQDWYGDYPGGEADPGGARSGTRRVLRGGSWFSNQCDGRSANRGGNTPDNRSSLTGFRLLRTP